MKNRNPLNTHSGGGVFYDEDLDAYIDVRGPPPPSPRALATGPLPLGPAPRPCRAARRAALRAAARGKR